MPYSNSVPPPSLNPSGLGYGAPPTSAHGAGDSSRPGSAYGAAPHPSGPSGSGRRPLPRPPCASGSHADPSGTAEDEPPIYTGEGGYRDEKRVASAGSVEYRGQAGQQYRVASGSRSFPAGVEGANTAEDGRQSRVSSGSMRPLPVLPPVSPSPISTPSAGPTSTPPTATHDTYRYASSRAREDTYGSVSANTSRTGHGTVETYPSSRDTYEAAGSRETGWTPPTSAEGYGHGTQGRGSYEGHDGYDGHDGYGATIKTPTVEKEQMASPEEYSGLGARRQPNVSLPDNSKAQIPPSIALPDSLAPQSHSTHAPPRSNISTTRPTPPHNDPNRLSYTDNSSLHSSSSHLNLDALKRPLSEIPQSAGSAFNAFPTARPHLPVPMTIQGGAGEEGSVRSFHTAESREYDREASGSAGPGTRAMQGLPPGASHQTPSLPQTQQGTPVQSTLESSSAPSPLSSWHTQQNPPSSWVQAKLQIHQGGEQEEEELEDEWDEQEVEEIHFFQPALLSEAAVQLRDRVERGRHLKGGIAWVGSFTGRDLVTTIQGFLPSYTRGSSSDRRFALLMAQSLQNQLWFVEVDWDIKPLRDSSEDVFRFMGDAEGMGDAGELPKGLMTMATRCYSPSCNGDGCYAPRCPYRTSPNSFLQITNRPAEVVERRAPVGDWSDDIDPRLLRDLSPEMMNRQNIIRQAIQSEVQYDADLTGMYDYVAALRAAQVVPFYRVESFIVEVFGNAMDLREACRRMMEHFAIRQREQAPLIQTVGDIFLEAATDFRIVYPEYTGNVPIAEQAIKKEMEENPEFARFNERMVREHDRRRDIKYLIARPTNQLQRYPAVLEAIINATPADDPDMDFLREALASIESLSAISQLKVVHTTKGKGKKEWFDLVPKEVREAMPKKEQKRQMIMWELIQGEMEYVTDLELLEDLFIAGLREADVAIIERSRLEIAIDDMFHNFRSLIDVHSLLLERLQARQVEQHPQIGTISDLVFDAVLNWQEAYMEYVTHYPIAKAKVQEESLKNPRFAAFLESCQKDPRSNRQDIYHFIYRPVPRLLRYNLLLENILEAQKAQDLAHPDVETIPQVMELIADLGRATQKGVAVNNAKVELWTFQHSLDGGKFGSRSVRDLDLLNPMRELIYKGRVFRQPDSIGSAWIELLLLLFDNYLVLAKPEKSRRAREGREVPSGQPVRYVINRRPIPLELLSLGAFGEAPRPRPTGRFTGVGSAANAPPTTGVGAGHEEDDTRSIWPMNILFIGQGQLGGQYTLFAESNAIRAEWKEKLLHARVLRAEVNDAGKVFEMTALSTDTFIQPPNYTIIKEGDSFTGQVTCSAPFVTPDGRSLVAIGCEEGVWIGLRGDAKSLRKVLHVKAVTSLAVLEEFGIFLVLQDRSLLAYHLEALVPTASSPSVRAAPQRLSQGKDIVFFTVGQLSGRTLVLYMKKKGMDSLFRVLEPIMNRGDAEREQRQQRRPFGNILGQRAEWFRLYKDFFIPTEALNVHFLKHKLAVVCAKGFEIMDLTDLKGGSIPIVDPAKIRDRPHLADLQRRCDSARPLGMFRSTETEFFLVYDSFGLYVDRHGEPNRAQEAIEWEGRPDSVAFHPPYVLLVSAQFIEIRHIDTAKLVQIYTGQDIRLTWDGTGGMARPFIDNPGPKGYGDEATSQDPRIHISQRADPAAPMPVAAHRPKGGIVQTVFELTPTLLLNNPLLNPVHTHDSNYFPPAPMVGEGGSSIRNGHAGSAHRQSRDTSYSFGTPGQFAQSMHQAGGYGGGGGYGGYGHGHGQTSGYGQTQGYGPAQGAGQGQGYGYAPSGGYGSINHRPSSISTSTSDYYYANHTPSGNGNGNGNGNGSMGMQSSTSGIVPAPAPMSTNASMINAWQAAQQPFAHAYGQHVQQQQQQQQSYRSRESYDSAQSAQRPPVYPDQRQYSHHPQQQQQGYGNQYQTPQSQQGYGHQYNHGGTAGARGSR